MTHQTLAEEKVVFRPGTSGTKRNSPGTVHERPPTIKRFHRTDRTVGRGQGVANVELATLHTPVVNWQVFSDQTESDAYGSSSVISLSVSASESAVERCGRPCFVMISSEFVDGNRQACLNIVSGNDAKIAWRASLGRPTPFGPHR